MNWIDNKNVHMNSGSYFCHTVIVFVSLNVRTFSFWDNLKNSCCMRAPTCCECLWNKGQSWVVECIELTVCRANKCDSCHIFVDTVVQLFIVFNFLSVEIEVIWCQKSELHAGLQAVTSLRKLHLQIYWILNVWFVDFYFNLLCYWLPKCCKHYTQGIIKSGTQMFICFWIP